jgi:DNA-binding NarL/FixJ family response regulator
VKAGAVAIRVLVADRSAPFRDTIRRVLDDYCPGCILVGEAADLKEATALALEGQLALVLLDFDLVANDEADQMRRLTEGSPGLRVIVLVTEYSDDYRVAVQLRWGYMCVAKDRLEEQLARILDDITPMPIQPRAARAKGAAT